MNPHEQEEEKPEKDEQEQDNLNRASDPSHPIHAQQPQQSTPPTPPHTPPTPPPDRGQVDSQNVLNREDSSHYQPPGASPQPTQPPHPAGSETSTHPESSAQPEQSTIPTVSATSGSSQHLNTSVPIGVVDLRPTPEGNRSLLRALNLRSEDELYDAEDGEDSARQSGRARGSGHTRQTAHSQEPAHSSGSGQHDSGNSDIEEHEPHPVASSLQTSNQHQEAQRSASEESNEVSHKQEVSQQPEPDIDKPQTFDPIEYEENPDEFDDWFYGEQAGELELGLAESNLEDSPDREERRESGLENSGNSHGASNPVEESEEFDAVSFFEYQQEIATNAGLYDEDEDEVDETVNGLEVEEFPPFDLEDGAGSGVAGVPNTPSSQPNGTTTQTNANGDTDSLADIEALRDRPASVDIEDYSSSLAPRNDAYGPAQQAVIQGFLDAWAQSSLGDIEEPVIFIPLFFGREPNPGHSTLRFCAAHPVEDDEDEEEESDEDEDENDDEQEENEDNGSDEDEGYTESTPSGFPANQEDFHEHDSSQETGDSPQSQNSSEPNGDTIEPASDVERHGTTNAESHVGHLSGVSQLDYLNPQTLDSFSEAITGQTTSSIDGREVEGHRIPQSNPINGEEGEDLYGASDREDSNERRLSNRRGNFDPSEHSRRELDGEDGQNGDEIPELEEGNGYGRIPSRVVPIICGLQAGQWPPFSSPHPTQHHDAPLAPHEFVFGNAGSNRVEESRFGNEEYHNGSGNEITSTLPTSVLRGRRILGRGNNLSGELSGLHEFDVDNPAQQNKQAESIPHSQDVTEHSSPQSTSSNQDQPVNPAFSPAVNQPIQRNDEASSGTTQQEPAPEETPSVSRHTRVRGGAGGEDIEMGLLARSSRDGTSTGGSTAPDTITSLTQEVKAGPGTSGNRAVSPGGDRSPPQAGSLPQNGTQPQTSPTTQVNNPQQASSSTAPNPKNVSTNPTGQPNIPQNTGGGQNPRSRFRRFISFCYRNVGTICLVTLFATLFIGIFVAIGTGALGSGKKRKSKPAKRDLSTGGKVALGLAFIPLSGFLVVIGCYRRENILIWAREIRRY